MDTPTEAEEFDGPPDDSSMQALVVGLMQFVTSATSGRERVDEMLGHLKAAIAASNKPGFNPLVGMGERPPRFLKRLARADVPDEEFHDLVTAVLAGICIGTAYEDAMSSTIANQEAFEERERRAKGGRNSAAGKYAARRREIASAAEIYSKEVAGGMSITEAIATAHRATKTPISTLRNWQAKGLLG